MLFAQNTSRCTNLQNAPIARFLTYHVDTDCDSPVCRQPRLSSSYDSAPCCPRRLSTSFPLSTLAFVEGSLRSHAGHLEACHHYFIIAHLGPDILRPSPCIAPRDVARAVSMTNNPAGRACSLDIACSRCLVRLRRGFRFRRPGGPVWPHKRAHAGDIRPQGFGLALGWCRGMFTDQLVGYALVLWCVISSGRLQILT